MTLDYRELGFKCGLEIHQRLETGNKLFCRCPCSGPEGKTRKVLSRRLRAVAGELGKIDPAAAFEMARGKTFLYETVPQASCAIEEDEEPPREINPFALKTCFQISNALSARVLDEVHVMRKTVADGSAVSAFQRTALLATDGKLNTSQGIVKIATVCLEEESSFIVEKKESQTRYRLDRLGIPLVEIATDAGLKNPRHVREAAESIGLLLRASQNVQRGIGTIRQDVNVSIEGGSRVEIKGAQELSELEALVENEVLRQKNLLGIAAELKKRGLVKVAFGKPHSVTHIFKNAKPFLSEPLKKGNVALAIKLLFCKNLLGKELMPGVRFGTELSDYGRVHGVKGMVHCDENPENYGLTQADFHAIFTELSCIENDGWAVVVADESRALKALRAIFERAFITGIPKETRRATGPVSRFLRPLPGAARMYPETDVLPVRIIQERVMAAGTLQSFEERKKAMQDRGLNAEMAEKILRSPEVQAFENLCAAFPVEQKTVAWLLTDVLPTLRREGIETQRVEEVLSLLSEEKITKSALLDLLKLGAKEPSVGLEALAKNANLYRIKGANLMKLADELGDNFQDIMRRFRLQVDATELQSLLRKHPPEGNKT